ncbi:unnamed protein product [Caenorhabditis nigoni]
MNHSSSSLMKSPSNRLKYENREDFQTRTVNNVVGCLAEASRTWLLSKGVEKQQKRKQKSKTCLNQDPCKYSWNLFRSTSSGTSGFLSISSDFQFIQMLTAGRFY